MGLKAALAESESNQSQYVDRVFRPDVKLTFPNKDKPLNFCILPAIYIDPSGNYDKSQYLAYRGPDDRFTEWVYIFQQHRSVGKTLNLLSPKFFNGPDVKDPVELMFERAWHDERFWPMIRKDPVTKKLAKDAYKTAFLRRPEFRAVLNIYDPFDPQNPENNSVLVAPKTAIFAYGYEEYPDKVGQPKRSGIWGLAEALDQPNRNVPADVPQHDFATRFYEGDITSPNNLAICQIQLSSSPQGGLDTYNCSTTDAQRVPVSMNVLLGRKTPEEIFVDVPFSQMMDDIFEAMRDVPMGRELMLQSWTNAGMEFDSAIARLGLTTATQVAMPVTMQQRSVTAPIAAPASAQQPIPAGQATMAPAPAPVQQAPGQQAPVQQAPVQQAPVQQVPATTLPAGAPRSVSEGLQQQNDSLIPQSPPAASLPPMPADPSASTETPESRRRRISSALQASDSEEA